MALPSSNIFMLILIISTLTISTCDGGSGYPLAAKESLLRFWRRVLPNVKLPPLLMEAASPLDATSLSVFAGFIESHTIADHIASFCKAADILCPGNEKSIIVPLASNIAYHVHKQYSSASASAMEEGQFFREKLLVQGSNLSLPNLSFFWPERSFLPRSLAEKLPSFSSQSLPELMQMFGILKNSSMGIMMAKTLQECEVSPFKGEIKKCVTTVEGMAEFAVGILGAKMEVLATWSTAGSGERVQVGEVKMKDRGKTVLCHSSMFPYLVYYCHLFPNLKVYEVSLMQKNEKINDGVVICHMDTTDWSAEHVAFMALGHKPGEIEVCHWIYKEGFVWVPQP